MNWLVLLSLIGASSAYSRLTHKPINACLFLIISLWITLLYVAALAHQLTAMSYTLLIVGWMAVLAAPFYLWSDRSKLLSHYFTPGFISLIFVIIIFGLIAQQLLPHKEDEFTHWAAHARLIYLSRGLIPESIYTIHKAYPPASALFYYPFFLLGGYTIGKAYFAQSLFYLAPIGLLARENDWRHWARPFILLFIAVISLSWVGAELGPYLTLYMDTGVGLYWGALIVYARLYGTSAKPLLGLAAVVMVFMLLKPSVLPLLLLALVIIGSQTLLLSRRLSLNFLKTCLMLLGLLVIGIISEYSWVYHLKTINVATEWHMNIISQPVRNAITFNHFFHKLPALFITASFLTMIAIILSLVVKLRKPQQTILITQILLWLGMMAYVFGLLALYLYAFTEGEGESLASFDRYMQIFYIGWCMILLAELAFIFPELVSKKIEPALGIIAISLLVIGYVYFDFSHHKMLSNKRKIGFYTHSIETIVAPVLQLTPPNSRLFTVWQNTTGEPRAMILYHTLPRVPNDPFSFGAPYASNDQWTKNLTPNQLKASWSNYDYVLLAYTDAQFWQRYGTLFPMQPPRLTPIIHYQLCIRPGFNGVNRKGCIVQTLPVYLFKIVHQHGTVRLLNVAQ